MTKIRHVFFDIGGVLATNGWDREQRKVAIAQFGLDQLKRREEGKINAEQHLGENMAFIKQSTEKRLERLRSRMEKE